jgi:hypothetical protein
MGAALRAHVSLYKFIADHFRKALAAASSAWLRHPVPNQENSK